MIFLSSVLTSGCKNPPPLTEICIIGDAGLLCIDRRRPKEEQEYTLPIKDSLNYICTNGDDYALIQEWMIRKCSK